VATQVPVGRWWKAWTARGDADDFEESLRRVVLPRLESLDGCRGTYLFRRELDDETEFATLALFDSFEAIASFAGDDTERAVVFPEARPLVRRFDEFAEHFMLREAPRSRGDAADTYRAFLDALNSGDLDAAEANVDRERWREICVGFTSGVIQWPESRRSMEEVWKGIPDLRFDLDHLVSDGTQVVAVGRVHGRQTGRLFGAPATRRTYSASMFDYVRVEDGRIVDRIQQADLFGQFRQLFGPLLVGALVAVALLLLGVGVVIGAFAL